MTHERKLIREAMDRLRDIAKLATVKDENGNVMYDGYLRPGDIEIELSRIYRLALKKGRREGAKKQ